MTDTDADREPRKVTFRKRGKAHRGLMMPFNDSEYLVAACSCPGSQNGTLTNGASIICDGWDRANCEN